MLRSDARGYREGMTLFRDSARRVAGYLPARVELLLRAARSRRELGGFYAPGSELSELVPPGKLAIDAGANVGVYSYWIARSASQVVAFEPQPRLAERLATNGIRGLVVHNVGLSDGEDVAELHVPRAHGEASLRTLDVPVDSIRVPLRTLDSYGLKDVGFFKVDVEGYEEPLLRGAEQTLRHSNAVVYIEIEERHNPGGIGRIIAWLGSLGYTEVQFRQHRKMLPLAQFDLERDQLNQQPRTPGYANNFLFRRPSR